MSAINESIWFGIGREDISGPIYRYKVWRYDIVEGDFTEAWTYDSDVLLSVGYGSLAWDGSYHIWVTTSGSGFNIGERTRINDLTIDEFPAFPVADMNRQCYGQNWGSQLCTIHVPSAGGRLWGYSFATKQWGAFPDEDYSFGDLSSQVPVPPWATYYPGDIFVLADSSDATRVQYYDYSSGWSVGTSMLGAKAGGKNGCWTDYGGNEYIYTMRDGDNFDRLNMSTDVWTKVGDCPATYHNITASGSSLIWDGDQYLFYMSDYDEAVYRFDLNAQSWSSYIEVPANDGFDRGCIAYTPRIRFIYQDSNQSDIYDITSLGSVPKGTPSDGVKYYLKALETESGTVTLGKLTDGRTDADDVLQLADDDGGSPGTWGNTVNMGSFSANQSKAFWMRSNTLSTTGQEAKVARLNITIT